MLDSLLTQQGRNYKLIKQQQEFSPSKNQGLLRGQNPKFTKAYSKRSMITIILIILSTFEIILIVNSKVYIDHTLLRTFLSFYADRDAYPDIFAGDAYYINIQNISQLQSNIQFIMDRIVNTMNQTLININYTNADIFFQVQYHSQIEPFKNSTKFIVNPDEGILQPFNLQNITDIQMFLMDVYFFQLVISNLMVQNDGLNQKYVHRIIYEYSNGNEINVGFSFNIDNILASSIDFNRPQSNILIFLRLFYVFIMFLAFASLYFNARYVRRALKEFYLVLERRALHKQSYSRKSIFQELNMSDIQQIDRNILNYLQAKNLTINNVKWRDYMVILQFDVTFSILANILQIISNFYLLFGREHQQMVGLGCLFTWMTLFRTLKNHKKLILMYQLIRLSLIRVIQFTVSFLIIFMAYAVLGLTIFPKVKYFCSLSYSVTTLVSMMAGDSIRMFTKAISDKYGYGIAMAYIFSYVIMFMHAIHNTLTSIIKEFFIIRKIQLIHEQKQRLGQHQYVYLSQKSIECQQHKRQLPLKLTYQLSKQLFKLKKEIKFKQYGQIIRNLLEKLQTLSLKQKWDVFDSNLQHSFYIKHLQFRLQKIFNILTAINNNQKITVCQSVNQKASQLSFEDQI